MAGGHVREIADEPGFPVASTIYAWLASNEAFRELYAVAKDLQMDAMAEEILAIADDGRNDWVEKYDQEGNPRGSLLDKEAVMRSKLRVDTRKWIMAHRSPKKYGDKIAVEASGPEGKPIEVLNSPVTIPALDLVLAKLNKLAGKDDAGPESA
jgi:hypothetical protein